ncbi:MAG TPA: TIGR03118 family protein, partial [Candidatus Sulfotelmatobacter sp.]
MPAQSNLRLVATVTGVLVLSLSPALSLAGSFAQTNLVSDVTGLAATTDPNLKNPWGMSFSATSPFWVSNQVSGNATLYDGAG